MYPPSWNNKKYAIIKRTISNRIKAEKLAVHIQYFLISFQNHPYLHRSKVKIIIYITMFLKKNVYFCRRETIK